MESHTYINQKRPAQSIDDDDDDDNQEGYELVGPPLPRNRPNAASEPAPPPQTGDTKTKTGDTSSIQVRRRKILILVACTVINFCQSIVFSMALRGKSNADLGEKADDIRMALVITRRLGAPVAALLMIRLGYRIVGLSGCVMVGLGLFIAAWVPRVAVDAIAFLVGGVAGLGFAFLSFTVIVPILETFSKHRLRSLVLVQSGEAAAGILFTGITLVPGIDIDWRLLYRYQLIVVVVAGAACVALKPVETTDSAEDSTKLGRLLGVQNFSIFKGLTLYLLMLVYFTDQLGKSIPVFETLSILLDPEKGFMDNPVRVILVMPFVGSLVGLLALLVWNRAVLTDVLLIAGVINMGTGVLTFQAPALDKFAWVVIYSLLFGMASGVFFALVDNIVPVAFGKRSVRIVEGLLGLASGVGHVIALPVSEAIQGTLNAQTYEPAFYLSGSALVTSGILAIGFRFLLLRQQAKNQVNS